MELLLLIPTALLGYLLLRETQRSKDLTEKLLSERETSQKLQTATLDEWSSDRSALLDQLSEDRRERLTEIAREREEMTSERREWAKERSQLLNRVQRPDMAVYENFEPSNLRQGINPEDDEAYWAAQGALDNGDS